MIKESGIKSGVSLNPSTPVWNLETILPDIDLVLLMSVNPGFGGQTFIPQAVDKLNTLKNLIRKKGLSTIIEVDGGIKLDNVSSTVRPSLISTFQTITFFSMLTPLTHLMPYLTHNLQYM